MFGMDRLLAYKEQAENRLKKLENLFLELATRAENRLKKLEQENEALAESIARLEAWQKEQEAREQQKDQKKEKE